MARSHWLRVCAARLVTPSSGSLSLRLRDYGPLASPRAATRRFILQKTRRTGRYLRGILPVRGFGFSFTPLKGVLFAFPSRYSSLPVALPVQPWIVVDPDSRGVPRAPRYSGTATRSHSGFGYGALTLSGPAFQPARLPGVLSLRGSSPCGPPTPPCGGLGSSPSARRYSGNLV